MDMGSDRVFRKSKSIKEHAKSEHRSSIVTTHLSGYIVYNK